MSFVGFCFLVIVGYGVYVYVQKKRLEDYVPPHKKYLDPRPGTGGSSGGSTDD